MKFTKEFTDAVEQKNRLRVRIMLKDAFLLDKTGDTFGKMEQYAAERMPELYEAHDEEILLNQPEQWTIDYFNDQMVKVVGNFSRERVALLKKMATALFGEKAETAAPTERTETSAPERGSWCGTCGDYAPCGRVFPEERRLCKWMKETRILWPCRMSAKKALRCKS